MYAGAFPRPHMNIGRHQMNSDRSHKEPNLAMTRYVPSHRPHMNSDRPHMNSDRTRIVIDPI
jgi:hypothetical protein